MTPKTRVPVDYNGTRKHFAAVVAEDQAMASPLDVAAKAVGEALEAGELPADAQAAGRKALQDAGIKNGSPASQALYELIKEKEQELQRRSVDLKWRKEHQPSKAEAYRLDRVAPVERELAILRDAYNALMTEA